MTEALGDEKHLSLRYQISDPAAELSGSVVFLQALDSSTVVVLRWRRLKTQGSQGSQNARLGLVGENAVQPLNGEFFPQNAFGRVGIAGRDTARGHANRSRWRERELG